MSINGRCATNSKVDYSIVTFSILPCCFFLALSQIAGLMAIVVPLRCKHLFEQTCSSKMDLLICLCCVVAFAKIDFSHLRRPFWEWSIRCLLITPYKLAITSLWDGVGTWNFVPKLDNHPGISSQNFMASIEAQGLEQSF